MSSAVPRTELVRLLAQTREWLNGCRGVNATSEDEPCDCVECEDATALLEAVDAALGRAERTEEGSNEAL